MTLREILNSIPSGSTSALTTIADGWYQGRTAYGGLSTAIAYHAAAGIEPDLPPLQSAQVAFVGPLAGEVEVRAKMLRRGRNTAFVQTEVESEAGIGHTATFIFMAPRESHVSFEGLTRPEFPEIPSDDAVRSGPPEYFTGKIQYPNKRLVLGKNMPYLGNWHRLTDRDGVDPVTELLLMGDVLPPSAMGLMTEQGMVSSMNWQVNLLTGQPTTKDGWWFVESRTHHAENGASSQYMSVWNSDQKPMMTGMQSVAIFV